MNQIFVISGTKLPKTSLYLANRKTCVDLYSSRTLKGAGLYVNNLEAIYDYITEAIKIPKIKYAFMENI